MTDFHTPKPTTALGAHLGREQRLKRLEASHARLLAVLEPFARWAEAVLKVEQPDYLPFDRLDTNGCIFYDEITSNDLEQVRQAIKEAKEL